MDIALKSSKTKPNGYRTNTIDNKNNKQIVYTS